MAAYQLFQNSGCGPDDVAIMAAAYEEAISRLDLNGRTSSLSETVAKRILEIARAGEKDPRRMCEFALRGMGVRSSRTHP